MYGVYYLVKPGEYKLTENRQFVVGTFVQRKSNLKGKLMHSFKFNYCILFGVLIVLYSISAGAQGNVGIGTSTPGYTLDIASEGERTLNLLNNSPFEGLRSALYIENSGEGDGTHYGTASYMTGPGSGTQYGAYLGISNSGDGTHYGNYYFLNGTGSGIHYGARALLTGSGQGDQIGYYALLNNTGDGKHYGVRTNLTNGNGLQYGVYNSITNSGDGTHCGTTNYMNATGAADQYGVFNTFVGNGDGGRRGTYNGITDHGNGYQAGTVNFLNGNGSGHHYGSSTTLGGLGNGDQVGVNVSISNDGEGEHYGINTTLSGEGSGTKYSIFSWVGNQTGGTKYSGYFTGDVVVTGNFSNPSDRMLKRDIHRLEGASSLDRIVQLPIYQYRYDREKFPWMSLPEGQQTGPIAQEVKTLFPELVVKNIQPAHYNREDEGEKTPGQDPEYPEVTYLGVNYSGFVPHLIKGMQEQQEYIDNLESKVDQIQKELQELKNTLLQGK